ALAHEVGDLRRGINVTVAAPGIPANKTRKFSRTAGDDNIILIRLAELYLIRAEARARKTPSDIAGAQADLNVIRTRAGLAPTTAATTADLILAIQQERRIELAHEGHRWFDLRRYNNYGAVGITEAFRSLWPIPQREVLTSGNIITQNSGY
ncbi:MAG: RagB/SusD family nutrient uptake outer membrane protein, partial [Bacteroidota bacterium]